MHKFTVGQLVQFQPDRDEQGSAAHVDFTKSPNDCLTMAASTNIGLKANTKSLSALPGKVS
jgi:hypothetical protein